MQGTEFQAGVLHSLPGCVWSVRACVCESTVEGDRLQATEQDTTNTQLLQMYVHLLILFILNKNAMQQD